MKGDERNLISLFFSRTVPTVTHYISYKISDVAGSINGVSISISIYSVPQEDRKVTT